MYGLSYIATNMIGNEVSIVFFNYLVINIEGLKMILNITVSN